MAKVFRIHKEGSGNIIDWQKSHSYGDNVIKQIKEHKDTILDISTFGILVFVMSLAFYVDSFGFADVPTWIYVVGIIYIGLYLILNYKRFF